MIGWQPWLTSLAVLIGNCGFWLYCFNRINAAGLPRNITKLIERLLVLICFSIPVAVYWVDQTAMDNWLWRSSAWWPASTYLFTSWGTFCLVSAAILGPPWLESRRWIWPPEQLVSCHATHFDIEQALRARGAQAAVHWRPRLLNKIPGNQITQLEVNRKELRLERAISGIDGLTIGHISDLHFTGHYSLDMHHFIIDRLLELEPQLIVVAGDIIDYARCLTWIEPVLGRLRAPLGCVFVLGNHDKRIAAVHEVTERMVGLGHVDLGERDWLIQLSGQTHIYLSGNELPWFDRHQPSKLLEPFDPRRPQGAGETAHPRTAADTTLRIGLSHSPDQIGWARRRRFDVLLAGHTHGGQVRLPGLGPLVSPSRFGSRFASGVFYREPVLMHVSRGISGVHPMRWRCLPEVSLLTLRS